MTLFKCIFLLGTLLISAQETTLAPSKTDTTYLIIHGDSVPRKTIRLDEVTLLNKIKFASKKDRLRYLILRRKTLKVFPYAKLAADRLDSMSTLLLTLNKNRDKKRYTKRVQKYIEENFSDELKKFSRTEGQILVKLIHRQTGSTAFNLVKQLRSGWRAFWYQTTASMFDISLKQEFDPWQIKEDYLIEDILQRCFQKGSLQEQASYLEFDFFELSQKWLKQHESK